MFSTSTQRRYWMYESPDELENLRIEANTKSAKNFIKSGKINSDSLLSYKEELYLIRSYLVNLREFCRKFQPQMRKSIIATAFVYMKRFYLHESCMDYHPRDIGITCAYLACKVDEFNVSIDQFIKNVNGDCRKAQKTVLSNELLLMKKLNFHLTVYLPFRPVEGFLIDLRARFPPARDKLESMSQEIEDYLDKLMFTDACFLYTPSQIALAAIVQSAEKFNLDLMPYLQGILFLNEPDSLDYFLEAAEGLKKLLVSQNSPSKDVMKKVEKKYSAIQMAAWREPDL